MIEFDEISDEERTRHEALFFSLHPIDGLLPSEKASEFFLQSKLSLHVLSRIWNLVDVPRDNMLDASEFVLAMHLLQWHMRGKVMSSDLPHSLRPQPRSVASIPLLRQTEWTAYKRLFKAVDVHGMGSLSGESSRNLLANSGLCRHLLAVVWNMGEMDRDGRLNSDEFTIVCHLVRHLKKGLKLNGPVNTLSILPHRLPKTDLATKRARVSELESHKRRLMTLKERRKDELVRETRRSELWVQRLALLRQLVSENPTEGGYHNDIEALVEDEALKTAAVAYRLKKEYERVRQCTARVIIQEQQLSVEVKQLTEEAESLQKRRQRSSIIKDLDPFHQLHEDKKEERITGIRTPKKKPSVIQIPHKIHPFDVESLDSQLPISGQELFECFQTKPVTAPEKQDAIHCPSCSLLGPWKDMAMSASSVHGPWVDPEETDEKIEDLTLGFEDDFVDKWSSDAEGVNSSDLGIPDLDKEFAFQVDNDPVFHTVSVTEEEDDLWRSLPITPNNSFASNLTEQLAENSSELHELVGKGKQILLRTEQDYIDYVNTHSYEHVTASSVPRRREEFHSRYLSRHKARSRDLSQGLHDTSESPATHPVFETLVEDHADSPSLDDEVFTCVERQGNDSSIEDTAVAIPIAEETKSIPLNQHTDPHFLRNNSEHTLLKEDKDLESLNSGPACIPSYISPTERTACLSLEDYADRVSSEGGLSLRELTGTSPRLEHSPSAKHDTYIQCAARDDIHRSLLACQSLPIDDLNSNSLCQESQLKSPVTQLSPHNSSDPTKDQKTAFGSTASPLDLISESLNPDPHVPQDQTAVTISLDDAHLATSETTSSSDSVPPRQISSSVSLDINTGTSVSPPNLSESQHPNVQGFTASTDIVHHRSSPVARHARLAKSYTWCVNNETPVPPPRLKSPRKKREAAFFKALSTDQTPVSLSNTPVGTASIPSTPQCTSNTPVGTASIPSTPQCTSNTPVGTASISSTPQCTSNTPVGTASIPQHTSHIVNVTPLSSSNHNVRHHSVTPNPPSSWSCGLSSSPLPPPRTKRLSRRSKLRKQHATVDCDKSDVVNKVTISETLPRSQSLDECKLAPPVSLTSDDKSSVDYTRSLTSSQDRLIDNGDITQLACKTSETLPENSVVITDLSPAEVVLTHDDDPVDVGSSPTLLDEINAVLFPTGELISDYLVTNESTTVFFNSAAVSDDTLNPVEVIPSDVDTVVIDEDEDITASTTRPISKALDESQPLPTPSPITDCSTDLIYSYPKCDQDADDFPINNARQLYTGTGCDKDLDQAASKNASALYTGTGCVIRPSELHFSPDPFPSSPHEACDLSCPQQETFTSLGEFLHNNPDLLKYLDAMDTASRKRELEMLRARYFKPSVDETEGGQVTSAPAHYTADTHHRSVTILNINGTDEGVESEEESVEAPAPSADDPPRYRNPHGTHMTTITITSPTEAAPQAFPGFDDDEPEECLIDVEEPQLKSLPRASQYGSTDAGDELVIDAAPPPVGFSDNVTSLTASNDAKCKSKIILDLDDFQYRPEFVTIDNTSMSSSPAPPRPLCGDDDMTTGDLLGLGDLSAPLSSPSGSGGAADSSHMLLDLDDDSSTKQSTYSTPLVSPVDSGPVSNTLTYSMDTWTSAGGASPREESDPRELIPTQVTSVDSDTRGLLFSDPDGNQESVVDDSDVSDDDNPFEATFDPAAANKDTETAGEHNDSGIVLVSYESKRQSQQEQEDLPPRLPSTPIPLLERASGTPEPQQVPPLPATPPPNQYPTTVGIRTDNDDVDIDDVLGLEPRQSAATDTVTAAGHSTAAPASISREGPVSANPDPANLRVGADKPRGSDNSRQADGIYSGTNGTSAKHGVPARSSHLARSLNLRKTSDPNAPDMDPVTGLKKVGVSTAVEKAFMFAEATEPSIRVKRKSTSLPPDSSASLPIQLAVELEHGRQEIMDSSRVKAKKVEMWVPPANNDADSPVYLDQGDDDTIGNVSHSQKKYEERKKKLVELKRTPPEADTVSTAAPLVMTAQSIGGADPRHLVRTPDEPSHTWGESTTHPDSHTVPSHPPTHESAIEREIRQARERELELKREREERLRSHQEHLNQDMPIYKVPAKVEKGGRKAEVVNKSPAMPVPQPPAIRPSYLEMTEADRDSEMLARENIIENEIREQIAREENFKNTTTPGLIGDKVGSGHHEGSEEIAKRSLIEEEIRFQQEREAEIRSQHSVAPAIPSQATPHIPDIRREEHSSNKMTDSSETKPVTPQTNKSAFSSVTYENAISTYAHAGESLIARELREQKEREHELRQHYKDMGLDMPDLPTEPQTPYLLPEPKLSTDPVRSGQTSTQETARNGAMRRTSIDSQTSNQSIANDQNKTVEEPTRSHKVRPFEDPDDVPVQSDSYMPQNETPIEREIRLAREREEALREQRGLPPPRFQPQVVDNDPGQDEVMTSTPMMSHNQRKKEERAGRGAMKRISNSRLQQEMQKEKEREEDLRKLGKIRTLSQDDAGQTRKYTDVIPKEALDGPPPLMKPITPTKSRGFSLPTTPAADLKVSTHTSVKHSPPVLSPAPAVTATHNGAPQESVPPEKPTVPLPNRYIAPPIPPVNSVTRSSTTANETKIERELRELQERELELKEQRRRLSKSRPPAPQGYHANNNQQPQLHEQAALSSNNGETEAPPMLTPTSPHFPLDQIEQSHRHASGEEVHHGSAGGGFSLRGSAASDGPVKAARRKSAMAEEWERKFGGN